MGDEPCGHLLSDLGGSNCGDCAIDRAMAGGAGSRASDSVGTAQL